MLNVDVVNCLLEYWGAWERQDASLGTGCATVKLMPSSLDDDGLRGSGPLSEQECLMINRAVASLDRKERFAIKHYYINRESMMSIGYYSGMRFRRGRAYSRQTVCDWLDKARRQLAGHLLMPRAINSKRVSL